ncbi:tRNA (adenosine(37)-N6)-threonylcarbamoyltransferase complex transferase subunit TsaD [Candidatus Daviesbacteria bacterium]|nr:tRNA (adenosine(37)-N6)-threonylcarbamoyltransferase complex transferase subunit TsaD [Candidatus Daviesbacteria bacterium]
MIILGIETTCDETGAAILQMKNGRITILSNVVASSAPLQAKYGGVIPEQAAREQIRSIIPVIDAAISNFKFQISNLNAIAVSQGPGLIGSLLVGVETAKTLSLIWKKPLIPVNHLIGHFYANWIERESSVKSQESSEKKSRLSTLATSHLPQFPCLGLLVSGGHTDLVLFTNHGKYKYLGGTRDDAAGECFDKCARLLGLPYPGGPEISKLAEKGKDIYKLPRPMINDGWDFSFSGLKTAVASTFKESKPTLKVECNLAASIEAAIVDVLVIKTIRAAQKYKVEQIIVAGGVAANEKLVRKLKVQSEKLKVKLHNPPPNLCTDNAAMIAAAAFFQKPIADPLKLQADPNLSLAS